MKPDILQDFPTYFDYTYLMEKLRDYRSPRSKVTTLLREGCIIQIRRGLYVLGNIYRRDISLHVLANLIYGPSYISFESALSYYGFNPERVVNPTSVCFKRKKQYSTPLGVFTYH